MSQQKSQTEWTYGYDNAAAMGDTEPVNIEKMAGGTVDIPTEDYQAMVGGGIKNPNARDYWAGYNAGAADNAG